MKKLLSVFLILCTVLTALCGCKPTQLEIDYADFVQLNGVSYLFDDSVVPADRIGEKLGEVKRNPPTSVTAKEPPDTLDGDAARLAVGTEIFAINGLDSAKYVAAAENGKFTLYRVVESDSVSFQTEITM